MTNDLSVDHSWMATIRNPFRGSVVGDFWAATGAVDVDSIHREAFEACCQAVEFVRHGGTSAGVVIYGEPGSGKTHLIGRLRHRLFDSFPEPTLERLSQAFAYVRLNTNAASLARHVRQCLADDLLRSSGKEPSQFERLAITRLMEVAEGGGHLASWWESFLEKRREELPDLLSKLRERAGLSPAFVQVLRHLVLRQHRLDFAGWLRGDPLTPKAYERLDIAEDATSDPENVAGHVLTDFMRLAGSQIPLVLCFDQVEALQTSKDDTDALFSFGQIVADLSAAPNLVLISCIQSSLYQQLQVAVPLYALPRIQGHSVTSLQRLGFEQACLVLAHRMQHPLFAAKRPKDALCVWPLSESDVRNVVGNIGCTPRELLEHCAQRFDEIARGERAAGPRDVSGWLGREWERRINDATQQNTPAQSAKILRDGLPRLFQIVEPNGKSAAGEHNVGVDYIFTGRQAVAQVGIKVCEDDRNNLYHQLKTLDNSFPKRGRFQKLLLLRDARRPVSKTAEKTNQFLEKLEKKNAVFFRVPPEAFSALDALSQLLADAQSGDLDFAGRTVIAESVLDWLRQNLPEVLRELADLCVTPGGVEGSSLLVDQLQEYLLERCIVSVVDAAESLHVTHDQLLTAADRRLDLFGVVRGEPAALFSARLGSVCLNPEAVE